VRAEPGVGVVETSMRRASPAGVRSASIGVVSGVGGAGAGVAGATVCDRREDFDPHPGASAAAHRTAKSIRWRGKRTDGTASEGARILSTSPEKSDASPPGASVEAPRPDKFWQFSRKIVSDFDVADAPP